nr:MAG TPA: hypothetical protein [Caudoviricetes sp.]
MSYRTSMLTIVTPLASYSLHLLLLSTLFNFSSLISSLGPSVYIFFPFASFVHLFSFSSLISSLGPNAFYSFTLASFVRLV